MELPKARKALAQAQEHLGQLIAAAHEPSVRFRNEFLVCSAMIQRIGSIIDDETAGHRTEAFGKFWSETANDARFRFMRDVRNAEFKRGEERTKAAHNMEIRAPITSRASVEAQVIRGGEMAERFSYGESAKSAPPSADPKHSVVWSFSGGPYGGQEVLGFLQNYLDWMNSTILPEAERLST